MLHPTIRSSLPPIPFLSSAQRHTRCPCVGHGAVTDSPTLTDAPKRLEVGAADEVLEHPRVALRSAGCVRAGDERWAVSRDDEVCQCQDPLTLSAQDIGVGSVRVVQRAVVCPP
jgi:hypothetical protein